MSNQYYDIGYLEEEPSLDMEPGTNVDLYGRSLRGRILTLRFPQLFKREPDPIYIFNYGEIRIRTLSNTTVLIGRRKVTNDGEFLGFRVNEDGVSTICDKAEMVCLPIEAPPGGDDIGDENTRYSWVIREGWM